MKLLFLALVIPAVLCAPQKRVFFQEFVGSIFDQQTLKCDVQLVIDQVGTDSTEQACEAECHNLIHEGHILDYGCTPFCKSIQALAQYFHETPDPTADPATVCKTLTR